MLNHAVGIDFLQVLFVYRKHRQLLFHPDCNEELYFCRIVLGNRNLFYCLHMNDDITNSSMKLHFLNNNVSIQNHNFLKPA